MGYNPQTWVDNSTPLSAARMNNIESGLAASAQYLGSGTALPSANVAAGDFFLLNGTMYQYNGTKWNALVYNNDSGWVALAVNSPVNVNGSFFNHRVVNGVVYVSFNAPYSGTWSSTFTIATLPAGARPSATMYCNGWWYGNIPALIRVDTNGSVVTASGANASYGGLLGTFSFPVG